MHKKIGFALVEVLIAMAIIVISLFGFLAIQLSTLHTTQATYWASIAALQAANMVERLNADAANSSMEIFLWQDENRNLLPKGQGEVNCEKNSCTVKVIWYAEQTWQQFTLSM